MPPPAGAVAAAAAGPPLDDTVVTPVDTEPSLPARSTRRAWCPEDIVDEWGAQSFPASDPPAIW